MRGSDQSYWYILEGDQPKPVDLETYVQWDKVGGFDKHIIARTYLSRDGAEVLPYKNSRRVPRQAYALISTVFLCTDHGWAQQAASAAPVLFETMVAIRAGNPDNIGGLDFLSPQWRYRTADEARAMHRTVVAHAQQRLRSGHDLTDGDDWPEE